MKKSQFTEEQIAFALKQAKLGSSVEEVCRKMGISGSTYYKRRSQFAGMTVSHLSHPDHQACSN